ncbi:MAG: enoyl-CoA hydratase/isomerase family protein [Actinobacteria bacterium]|nr:enoyl-CoA hydratase/isomerase family protein [Actinomycetota bacterium]
MAEPADVVLTETRGAVTVLTLNRPHARNAVDAAVSTALGDALERANRDPQVRVVVLTGTGGTFCAGADIKAIHRGENLLHPEHPEWGFAGYVRHFVDKPTIAAVNGLALGGGTELALASDLVVADTHAVFGLPEVKLGLIAAAGGAFRIADQLPRKIAMQMMFTGDPIPASDALTWGLINEIADSADAGGNAALDAALVLAARVAANAPLAVQASKRVAYGVDDDVVTGDEPGWARTARALGALLASEDAREGPRAFAEKRTPVWQAR